MPEAIPAARTTGNSDDPLRDIPDALGAADSGEVIQLPVAQAAAGQAAVKSVKVGDQVVTVWSQQTAIKATVIR